MPTLTVNPNRMELLKLKRRLSFAMRGHKLLKDKQESLMQQFMKVLKSLQGMYEEVEKDLYKVYESYYQAQAGASPYALEEALEPPQNTATVTVTMKHMFGYSAPEFTVPEIRLQPQYSTATAPLAMQTMLTNVQTVYPRLIRLAQIEKQIELLAADIEKTRRRVNALEYNMIPLLQQTIRGISMKLEERDRSERTVLMKVKELLK